MINYPNSLPTEAVLVIVDKLRGKSQDWNSVLLAAWNLLGYALSQISISTPDRILDINTDVSNIAIETETDAANYIESNFLQNETAIEGKAPVQFSGVVLLVLIKIITKFIINVL